MKEKTILYVWKKILPISNKSRKIALGVYVFLVLIMGYGFEKIDSNNLKQGIVLGWLWLFTVKFLNEKYNLKRKLLKRVKK